MMSMGMNNFITWILQRMVKRTNFKIMFPLPLGLSTQAHLNGVQISFVCLNFACKTSPERVHIIRQWAPVVVNGTYSREKVCVSRCWIRRTYQICTK